MGERTEYLVREMRDVQRKLRAAKAALGVCRESQRRGCVNHSRLRDLKAAIRRLDNEARQLEAAVDLSLGAPLVELAP